MIVLPTDRENLDSLEAFLDPAKKDDEVRSLAPRLMKSSGEFKAEKTRSLLLARQLTYNLDKIVRYPFKPFDIRLAYLDSDIQPLFSRPSPELLAHRSPYNAFLLSRDTADKDPEGSPFYFSTLVSDYDCISGHSRHFPIFVRSGTQNRAKKSKRKIKEQAGQAPLPGGEGEAEGAPVPNLSQNIEAYLKSLGINDFDPDPETADLIWMHALAIGYSPAYLEENADGIRGDWPRIPLPSSKEALLRSAELGRRVAAFLDTEHGVAGVTEGNIEKPLDTIGMISRVEGGELQTEEDEDNGKRSELRISAGWGHGGKDGITMPGKGKLIERDYSPAESKAIEEGAKRQGLSMEAAFAHLGERTCDVYLNEVAYWRNIPARVWAYTIGGYQVIKKWLSYREHKLLGRPLTTDEAREVMNIARRIASILLLEPSLDANYQAIKGATYPWPLDQ